MKTQHTPGPWRHTIHSILAPNGAVIAKTIDSKLDHEAKAANARLIAAAPELLITLERAAGWLEHFREHFQVNGEGPSAKDLLLARAAIAKARGEA